MSGSIKLKHASGNGVIISAPSSNPAADRTLTLPSDADGVIAKTDSSGNLTVAGDLTVDTNTLKVDSSNNRVGIGTASPDGKLHVEVSSSGSSYTANAADTLILERNGGNVIDLRTPAANDSGLLFSDDTRAIGTLLYNHPDNSLRIGTNGSERMVIDSSGNVGIGTTSPSAKIHADNGGSGNVAFFKHASSGIAVTLTLQNNRATGSLAGEQISFLDDTGTQRGKITSTTSATSYVTSSDYRLKENEVLISDGIERIKKFKPYKFNWKHIPNKIVDGFFAHEVENLVEDCVDGIKDRVVTKEDHDKGDYLEKKIGTEIHQMIDHSKLVPLLTAALQEAIVRIEALEAK